MPIVLKDLTTDQLHDRLACVGLTPRQARQIHAAVMRRGALPAADEGIAAKLLDEVRRRTAIPNLALVEKTVSPQDGFAKYLFRGDGPERFEAVRIPLLHRPDDLKYVVCVSSQVGCAMRCEFCATGRMGFRRNLAAWEIVDQVIKVRADSPYPVRGVVFMGMGEPMLNYDACDPSGADSHGIVGHGHQRQGHHDLDGRHRARHSPFHRGTTHLSSGRFAELG